MQAASDSRWQQRMAKEMDLDISDNEADAVPKSRKGQPVALTTPQLTALQQVSCTAGMQGLAGGHGAHIFIRRPFCRTGDNSLGMRLDIC